MREDFYGFVGINMLMFYHKRSSWNHYWNTDPDFNVPFVSTVMTRDRFGQILANLHVNDNAAIPDGNQDKLYKLQPLIDMMNNNYIKLYNVLQKLSVDESMIFFKGRHSIKQYNFMKLIKRWYKMWVRADMDGYIKATNANDMRKIKVLALPETIKEKVVREPLPFAYH